MSKKTYNKPLIFDDYVDEEPQGGVSSDIWGSQW